MKRNNLIIGMLGLTLVMVFSVLAKNWKHSTDLFCDSDVEALSGCEVSTKYGSNFDRCDGSKKTTCTLSYHGTYMGIRIDADLSCDGTKIYAK